MPAMKCNFAACNGFSNVLADHWHASAREKHSVYQRKDIITENRCINVRLRAMKYGTKAMKQGFRFLFEKGMIAALLDHCSVAMSAAIATFGLAALVARIIRSLSQSR